MNWRFVSLPPQDGPHMITSFVAVADYVSKGGKNTFLTFTTSEPFVNVGVHQEIWLEVDMDFVRRRGLTVVRRDLGGGTVVITDGEQDFFVVVNAEEAPAAPSKLYQRYLAPVVEALRSYGLNATLRDQDIVVNGRKISGNGAMTRGNAVVVAGNVLMRLDLDVIAGAIRVPSEKFRDKMAKDMSQWLTSLERELGYLPTREDLVSRLKRAFEEAGVRFEDSPLTLEEVEEWNRLAEDKRAESWTFYRDNRHPSLRTERCVKISSAAVLCHVDHKGRKLVRLTARIVDGKLDEVSISGDFFVMSPQGFLDSLEDSLRGVDVKDVSKAVSDAFSKYSPKAFGLEEADVQVAFQKLLQSPEVREVT
ncbi:ligase [Sulfodiicoccus acidiphilus]|uniref:Ligase n=1 Tax=Sulfodiicoccus acidiphilus TaxID=1670455 RepID=A0A348B1E2_9CREN|nr:biotin/lipoate A/B protein ligase family protein [Sulfodiicoccus acidiphilus]BBD71994.1 ligase [Sulfodiicoccus acidiphilus]GGT91988.1 ligase [Sulfodiicoccus acidiphilus]